jgi:hypothetical protein
VNEISYRVTYQLRLRTVEDVVTDEIIKVRARSINSGYPKVLKIANEPLGNGTRREIARIEFLEVL